MHKQHQRAPGLRAFQGCHEGTSVGVARSQIAREPSREGPPQLSAPQASPLPPPQLRHSAATGSWHAVGAHHVQHPTAASRCGHVAHGQMAADWTACFPALLAGVQHCSRCLLPSQAPLLWASRALAVSLRARGVPRCQFESAGVPCNPRNVNGNTQDVSPADMGPSSSTPRCPAVIWRQRCARASTGKTRSRRGMVMWQWPRSTRTPSSPTAAEPSRLDRVCGSAQSDSKQERECPGPVFGTGRHCSSVVTRSTGPVFSRAWRQHGSSEPQQVPERQHRRWAQGCALAHAPLDLWHVHVGAPVRP